MFKKLLFLIVFLLLGVSGIRDTLAADLTVTCSSNGPCTTTPSGPLFNETDLKPADTVSRNLTIINQDDDEACNLSMVTGNVQQSPQDFGTKLLTKIESSETTFFDSTFDDLFNTSSVSLGVLDKTSTNLYTWKAEFVSDADNSYQNASANFDFEVNFSCFGPPVQPTLSPAGPPTRSDESAGTSVTTSIAQAITPILGIEVEVSSTPAPTTEGTTSVEGVQTEAACVTAIPWWIPLLVQFVVGSGYSYWAAKRRKPTGRSLWPLGGFAIISQLAHIVIGCACATGEWCERYWILNLVVLGASVAVYLLTEKEKKGK